MTFVLDRETALTRRGPTLFDVANTPEYQNPFGVFGGWVGAVLTKAAEQSDAFRGSVRTVQVSYLAGPKGDTLQLETNLLRRGGKTDFWRATLSAGDDIFAVADIVAAEHRPTDLVYDASMPDIAAPETLPKMAPHGSGGPKWIRHFDQRMAKGVPFKKNDSPEAMVWIRETDGRPLDRMGLVALLDTPMPRSFYLSDRPAPGSTIAMSTYIYASEEQLATVGNDFVLLRIDGSATRDGMADQRVELWSREGIVLATSNQMVFFRAG